jgi:hypothetical protein
MPGVLAQTPINPPAFAMRFLYDWAGCLTGQQAAGASAATGKTRNGEKLTPAAQNTFWLMWGNSHVCITAAAMMGMSLIT